MKTGGWGLGTRTWGRKAGSWGLGVGGWGALIFITQAFVPGPYPAHGAGREANESAVPRMTVRLFNYAAVPKPTLKQAKAEASRIFVQVGTDLEWVDCPLNPEEAELNPICRGQLDPTNMVVRIQPRFRAAAANFFDVTLGFAPLVEGERGSYASVFYDRVEALAQGGEFSLALILGHAIAHEIGHMLLRTMRHSHAGLMRAHLGRDELKLARVGQLLFSPSQGALIREESAIRRRLTASAARTVQAASR